MDSEYLEKNIKTIAEVLEFFLSRYKNGTLLVKDEEGNMHNVPVSTIREMYNKLASPLSDSEKEQLTKLNDINEKLLQNIDDFKALRTEFERDNILTDDISKRRGELMKEHVTLIYEAHKVMQSNNQKQ